MNWTEKIKPGENLIDKVAFYSETFDRWYVGEEGFEEYMEGSGSLREHGVKEPYFEELKSLTYNPQTDEFILEDESGRTRSFNPDKYKFKLREAL